MRSNTDEVIKEHLETRDKAHGLRLGRAGTKGEYLRVSHSGIANPNIANVLGFVFRVWKKQRIAGWGNTLPPQTRRSEGVEEYAISAASQSPVKGKDILDKALVGAWIIAYNGREKVAF